MNSESLRDLLPSKCIELLSAKDLLNGNRSKIKLLASLLSRCLGDGEMAKDYKGIWQSLKDRERSMSTGVGSGVAIPHCSSPHIHKLCMYMAVLTEAIEFQSIDDIPVRIVVLILFPQQKYERYVELLSYIARILNNSQTREEILKAAKPAEVHDIMLSAQEAFTKSAERIPSRFRAVRQKL